MPPPERAREPKPAAARQATAQDKELLAEAIAPLKDASPGSPEAAVYQRLKDATGEGIVAFVAIHAQFKPARARQSHPLALWHWRFIDVLVRAERLRQKAATRKQNEENAQLVINAAVRAMEKDIRPFVALLEREADDEVLDYDLDAFGGGYPEADEAYVKLRNIIRDRREWGRSKLRNIRLSQKPNEHNAAVLAGLRDLVVSLDTCAPDALQSDIAHLAHATFGYKWAIGPGQVKEARKWMRKDYPQRGSALAALAEGKGPGKGVPGA